MLELTKEQMEAIQKAISKKAEESVQEFDKELDVVVSKLSTEGWTLPAELNIYAVKTIANTNKLDDINAFLKWFFTTEDFQKTKDMVNGIKASPIKEGLKNLTDQCWQAFQNKLYAVCATSLLSVIEGILSEFSDDKQDVRMMKVCQKKVDTFPSTGSTIQKHVWISYNNFIRNLYQKSDFSADEPETINRHWLLHGRSDFEIDEMDCIRLFNAVQSLCMIVKVEAKEAFTGCSKLAGLAYITKHLDGDTLSFSNNMVIDLTEKDLVQVMPDAKKIIIPKNVKDIEATAFVNTNIKTLKVSKKNKYLATHKRCLYQKKSGELIYVFGKGSTLTLSKKIKKLSEDVVVTKAKLKKLIISHKVKRYNNWKKPFVKNNKKIKIYYRGKRVK